MAFNFGAFVGGFSKQLVDTLEAEEERQFEMEKIAETEAMRQRAAASSRRRAEQAATEQLVGALSMFYGPDVAAEIAARGSTATEFALDAAQRAAERNVDPNTLWRMPTHNGDMSDPATQDTFSSTIDAASAPAATITPGEDATTPTITPDAIGTFGLNREVYSILYGEPDTISNSYDAALARNTQLSLRATDPAEIERLRLERQTLIEDLIEVNSATREPTETRPSFNYGTVASAVSADLRSAYNRYGFETDLEGNIINMTEGTEYRSYIAELSAAQSLESQYRDVGDAAMNGRIEDLRDQASRDLLEYGRRIVAEGSQGDGNRVSRRLQQAGTQENFANSLVSGQYRIGDVITYRDANGILRFAIYTGISNADGLPIIMGR